MGFPVNGTLRRTPPFFIHSVENYIVPVEMHIYPGGGHRYAVGAMDEHLKGWFDVVPR